MLRIALVQLNPVVGRALQNAERALALIDAQPDADIYVFPELSLMGYPPGDLLSLPSVLEQERIAFSKILDFSKTSRAIFLLGHTTANAGVGQPLYNSVSIIEAGRILKTFHKKRIPSYDIFDEKRFFEAFTGEQSNFFEYKGLQIGLAICEDSWSSVSAFGIRDIRNYSKDSNPWAVRPKKIDLLINMSASPFLIGKDQVREDLFGAYAQKLGCPLVYVSQVGGQDELIFDGGSFVVNKNGEVVHRAPRFQENLTCWTGTDEPLVGGHESCYWKDLLDALILGLKDFSSKQGFSRAVLGLSGGIDSALVAFLGARALGPENVKCVALPSPLSSPLSLNLAEALSKRLGTSFESLPIGHSLEALQKLIGLEKSGTPFENLQSRIRGTTLMALSNSQSSMLLSTGNKSELAMGYATLYGDMNGALLVIGDLYKTEVYGLCHYVNSLEKKAGRDPVFSSELLDREPTAELAEGQRDSDSLPEYEKLDVLLKNLIEKQEDCLKKVDHWNSFLAPHDLSDLRRRMHRQEFKRFQAAPILKVHSRSFGRGWRMPLAKGTL